MARTSKIRLRVFRAVAWLALATPLVWLALRFRRDHLGANPIEAIILWSGVSTLVLLMLTLAVTPVRRLTGWNEVVRVRRFLGLTAFGYLCLHFLSYVGLDQFFAFDYILADIAKRPFITAGFAAFLLLIPLAVTSTKGWIRRLGRRWQRLHQLVYIAATLGVLHYYWKVKADTRWPLVFAVVLVALLLLRLRSRRSGARRGERHRVPRAEDTGDDAGRPGVPVEA
ncbi:MAG: sulfoxide reductase heme-binding subunit YedZ [Gemmatimonadota bacterium]